MCLKEPYGADVGPIYSLGGQIQQSPATADLWAWQYMLIVESTRLARDYGIIRYAPLPWK